MEMEYTLEGIDEATKTILPLLHQYKVIAFSGELGAGKTTFISSLCVHLGVTEPITSPTYSIIQEYNTEEGTRVYHMDLYRIDSRQEALDAGIDDCLHSGEYCMVEWPDKVPGIFPIGTVYCNLQFLSANKRKMIVELPR